MAEPASTPFPHPPSKWEARAFFGSGGGRDKIVSASWGAEAGVSAVQGLCGISGEPPPWIQWTHGFRQLCCEQIEARWESEAPSSLCGWAEGASHASPAQEPDPRKRSMIVTFLFHSDDEAEGEPDAEAAAFFASAMAAAGASIRFQGFASAPKIKPLPALEPEPRPEPSESPASEAAPTHPRWREMLVDGPAGPVRSLVDLRSVARELGAPLALSLTATDAQWPWDLLDWPRLESACADPARPAHLAARFADCARPSANRSDAAQALLAAEREILIDSALPEALSSRPASRI